MPQMGQHTEVTAMLQTKLKKIFSLFWIKFPEIFLQGKNQWYCCIGSGNGLAPNRRQTHYVNQFWPSSLAYARHPASMTSHFLSEMMQEYACIYQQPSIFNMLTTFIVNVMMTDKPTDQHIDWPRCLSTAHEQITDPATDGAIGTQTHARMHVRTHARTNTPHARDPRDNRTTDTHDRPADMWLPGAVRL